MNIVFMPRQQVKGLIYKGYFEQPDVSLISISTTFSERAEMQRLWTVKSAFDSKALFLDFMDEDGVNSLFTLFKARSIIEFLDKLKDFGCKELVVHCDAGISRSGAVVKFANIYLGLDIPKLNKYDMHNIYVFNTLCDCAGIETQQSYYKDLEKDHD
jgi:predicted protein tyrosine phosphatase